MRYLHVEKLNQIIKIRYFTIGEWYIIFKIDTPVTNAVFYTVDDKGNETWFSEREMSNYFKTEQEVRDEKLKSILNG